MKKRVLVGMLVGALALGLVGCGQKKETKETNKDQFKVAMITSEGGLGDRSFNDSGNEGLKQAKEKLNVTTKVVEPGDVSEGETYLSQLAESGMDLVITLDLGHSDVLKKVAKKYPDTQFAIFNTAVEGSNVSSVLFKEQEGSFLAGALSALVTQDTSLEQVNDKKIISFIGGIDSPGINIFLSGFKEGASHIDPEIKVLSGYTNSFADPAKGKETALSQIGQGSDIVFQAAGATGDGVIQAAKQKNVFAIGVDSDQDGIAKGNVLTSVMKRVDNAVYGLVEDGMKKEYQTTYELGLKEKGVELSPMTYTKDLISEDYLKQIEGLREQIISGEIKVKDIRK
ncbi:BMP family lipoprotein [Vagococcus humatus]|uniref:BMP family ABC transporter substrate-binding protein n=1 Tax=Vagococcus humatus TaxID=1889241 RepID=A0A3S0ABW0_9ENTE|nr:BMP family ABC transporter substrate-binding protein [Vagococcus humatus]RST89250.1 BMP family ABC transporter substrate-binding protein [Vagococcus humatus]